MANDRLAEQVTDLRVSAARTEALVTGIAQRTEEIRRAQEQANGAQRQMSFELHQRMSLTEAGMEDLSKRLRSIEDAHPSIKRLEVLLPLALLALALLFKVPIGEVASLIHK